MKLSVITINYNNIAGLRTTVESVLSQADCQFEYLIIDGGSTDGSADYIAEISGRLSFWCSEPDGGIYKAMNKGVGHSTGDYVLFLNSGDSLTDSQSLSRIVPKLGTHDFVYGNLIFHENDGREWIQAPPDRLSINFFMNHSLPHPATCIRRKLLIDTPYDVSYKIIADWVYFVKKIVWEGASTLHVDSVISRFMMDGVSSGTSAHDVERGQAMKELFPPLIAAAGKLENSIQKSRVILPAAFKLNRLFHRHG